MQAIKFRAWDSDKKIMNKDVTMINGRAFKNEKPAGIPMQYTGLRDNNDKEIYDGDILKVMTKWRKAKGVETIDDEFGLTIIEGETYWSVEHKIFTSSMGYMTYGIDRRFHKPLTNSRIWNSKAVVVSNIYESPELVRCKA